jgi:uncharacterized membrane protein YczE
MEETVENSQIADCDVENNKKQSDVQKQKKKRKPSTWALHILFYVIGLAVLALGVSVSRQAGLGLSQLVILPSVFSRIDPDPSHNMGWWVGVVFIAFVVVQILVLRKDFKPIQLLQIPVSLLYGFLIGMWNSVVASIGIPMPNYFVKLFFSALGVVIMGVGISIYLTTDIVPLSSEGAPLAISQKLEKPFPRVKQIFDLSLVALAVIASLIGLHTIYGEDVREGTIIAAVCLGPLIAFANKFTAPLKRFLNKDND